jgi:cyclophilin family peptidyl-prolyl cis-trans isomerase
MCPNKKRSFNKAPRKRKSTFTKYMYVAIALIAIIAVVSIFYINSQAPKAAAELTGPSKVLLQTSSGNITIQLRIDKPVTSGNFRSLVEQGKYDGTIFHRTMAGFMIQSGQINGRVASIKDEIGSNNRNVAYSVAMAKTSLPNSATSGFFINVADNGQKFAPSFDQTYTVFGTVISGQDIVNEIANAPATENPNMPGEISVPVNPVTVIKAIIIP